MKRDSYQCQRCGAQGRTEASFEISGYSSVDQLMKDCTINNEPVSTFLKSAALEVKPDKISVKHCGYSKKGHQVYMFDYADTRRWRDIKFAVKGHIYSSSLKCLQKEITLYDSCKNIDWKVVFFAINTRPSFDMERSCHSYYKVGGDYISITIRNSIFCFIHSRYTAFPLLTTNFASLNVHHKYYVRRKQPWEYDDDALITLCSDCHGKVHEENKIPLLYEDRKGILCYPEICDRCGGTGILPQYSYYMNGVCFKCGGEGVLVDSEYHDENEFSCKDFK